MKGGKKQLIYKADIRLR